MDDFGGTILNEMQPDTRDLWIQARFHIIYLLEVIMGKNDLGGNVGKSQVWPSDLVKAMG